MAKKQDLKSMVSGVLEGALREAPLQAPEVERRLAEMAPAPVASRVLKLPLDRIYPDPDQPRRTFLQESLEELAASIREQGVLEPIQVIATDQGYQLLHGERRWRAAHLAGLTWIPSIIYEQPLSDADRLIRQLIENIQREDLNDVDRATALERLKDLLNVSWEEVAEKVGLTVGRIHQLRRLSRLAPELQAAVKAGQISEKDTRPYQGLTEEQQVALYRAGQEESLPPDMVKQVADQLKRRPELVEGRRPDPSVGLGTGLVEGRRPEPPPTDRDRDRDRENTPGRSLSVEEEEISQAIRQVRPVPSPSAPLGAGSAEGLEHEPAKQRAEETKPDSQLVDWSVSQTAGTLWVPTQESKPYDDVETDRLLAHMEHVVGDFSHQLRLLVQTLRRRPLASWEQERIGAVLTRLQDTLLQLQR